MRPLAALTLLDALLGTLGVGGLVRDGDEAEGGCELVADALVLVQAPRLTGPEATYVLRGRVRYRPSP
jgi:hypothetical protein